jgi:hypothetical protein
MQFTGFSKAFMTGQATRRPVVVPFQHQCDRNRDALSKSAVPRRERLGRNPVRELHFPTRPGRGTGRIEYLPSNGCRSAERNMTADIDCGFQNAATLL